MNRPRLILALAALQLTLTLVYFGVGVYLIYLTTAPENMNAADAHDTVQGLLIGAATCAVFGMGTGVSSFGLWLMASWGRWLAVTMNGILALILIYSEFDQSHLDWDDVLWPVILTLATVPFFFPAVGRAIRSQQGDGLIPERR